MLVEFGKVFLSVDYKHKNSFLNFIDLAHSAATKFCNTMPVKRVLRYYSNELFSRAMQTIESEVDLCIKDYFNGVKEGSWKTTLAVFKPNIRDKADEKEFPGDLVGISLAGHLDKYFLVLQDKRIVVEAEASMQEMIEKQPSYRKHRTITFEGDQYVVGDFQVRLGKVTAGGPDRVAGISMEMEYLPISSWQKSHQMMDQFNAMWKEAFSKTSELEGEFVARFPEFAEYKLPDKYSVQHTAVQYAFTVIVRK